MPKESRGDRFDEIIQKMWPEGQLSVAQFLDACDNGAGGTLVIRAPFGNKRTLPEAGYRSERWQLLAHGVAAAVEPQV